MNLFNYLNLRPKYSDDADLAQSCVAAYFFQVILSPDSHSVFVFDWMNKFALFA